MSVERMAVFFGSGIGNMLATTPFLRCLSEVRGALDLYTCANFPESTEILKHPDYVHSISDVTEWSGQIHYKEVISLPWGRIDRFEGITCDIQHSLTMESARQKYWYHMPEYEACFHVFDSIPKPDIFEGFAISSDRDFPQYDLVFHAGCLNLNGRWKRWPYFLELASLLKEFKIAIIGTAGDGIYDWPENCTDYTGKLDLLDTGALLCKARLMVSNDSGMASYGIYLGVPAVIIYGGSDLIKNYRPGHLETHVAGDISCKPCWYTQQQKDCNDIKCLNMIKPETIEKIVRGHTRIKDSEGIQS